MTSCLRGAVGTAAFLVLSLAACTTAPPGGQESPTSTPGGDATQHSPTPGATPGATPGLGVVEDSLAILGGDAEEVERAVARFGGEIVDHVAETDTYVVRFDAGGIAELIALRDELREAGLDANLIPFLATLEG